MNLSPINDISELKTREDFKDYYTNVKLKKIKGKIYIPCGTAKTDNGFFICGIKETENFNADTVYALIYNYLLRNSTISHEDYPRYIKELESAYEINYQRVFRLMIIILQLIKNGYIENKLNISYDGEHEELKLAADVINNYAGIFSRLMRVKSPMLSIVTPDRNAVKISLDSKIDGVYTENNTKPDNARELWYGRKIRYALDESNLEDLKYILSEISPFTSFKEGQFGALTGMLNARGHSVCIMPTGSGKSLIFYFASLLQPLPLMIISPTEILIEDQIRNLKKFHHMDNVSHLKLTSDNDFSKFSPAASLMYLTPVTFQTKNLLTKCRYINEGRNPDTIDSLGNPSESNIIAPGPGLSYVVLDEIHCLSDWGHDFRPEYLMLSKNLNKLLDRISFLGFTATANYTVAEDIERQLNIPEKNIISPVNFNKYNISYNFKEVKDTEEMLKVTGNIVSFLIARGERTLIFTKDENISLRLSEIIGTEADVFLKDNPKAYHTFADGKSMVLITGEELGIGINLPDIQNIIHVGMPVSKNAYVQELGRAGREDGEVKSYVIYLKMTEDNIPGSLVSRDSSVKDIKAAFGSVNNDYLQCFEKISGGINSEKELIENVTACYRNYKKQGKALYKETYSEKDAEQMKKYIYMLYVTGFVDDWYAYSADEDMETVDLLIEISSSNHKFYSEEKNMFQRIRDRSSEYFDSIGNSREQIVKIRKAGTSEEIIAVYLDWYFSKFLYHHRELFLDFAEFITEGAKNTDERITEDISEYFTLPFVEIKTDEIYYKGLSLPEIAEKLSRGISRRTLANIERINSNRYSFNLDCMLLLGILKLDNRFDMNRFGRIAKNINTSMLPELKEAFMKVFGSLSDSAKIIFINALTACPVFFGDTPEEICTHIYSGRKKDIIFYGLTAQHINKIFEENL